MKETLSMSNTPLKMTEAQLCKYWDFLKTEPPLPQAGSGFSLDGVDYLTIASSGRVDMWMRKTGGKWDFVPPLTGNL